jgi:hypothetical protein
MRGSQIHITAMKLGGARMRCRNHGMMPQLHTGCTLIRLSDPDALRQ